MNEKVTVDEAILKGHRMVSYPTMLIICVTFGIALYLGIQEILPAWIYPAGLVLAFGFAWLWWSIMITKWRLWAFDNVRNIHELKKRAVQEKLIWKDNSIFEKTEIRGREDREKLRLLQNKFKQEDLFEDDLTVADETIIYYSKSKSILGIIIMIVCFCARHLAFFETDSYFTGSFLAVTGAYLGFKEYQKFTNTEPQITLNNKGIKTISSGFYNWGEIENEEVVSKRSGKQTIHCLNYKYPGGTEHLKIDGYDTDQRSLNKLLILYRGRSKKKIQAANTSLAAIFNGHSFQIKFTMDNSKA